MQWSILDGPFLEDILLEDLIFEGRDAPVIGKAKKLARHVNTLIDLIVGSCKRICSLRNFLSQIQYLALP